MTSLAGIDAHVHIHDAKARALQGPEAVRAFEEKARYLRRAARHLPMEEQAEQYRGRNMMAVLVNGRGETVTGMMLPLDRWLADFSQVPFKPEVRQRIMLDNARTLFGLDEGAP